MEILCSYKPESTHIRTVSHSSNITILQDATSTLPESSLRPQDSMFLLFFWKLKFHFKEKLCHFKEKLLLKPETPKTNKCPSLCISDMCCDFLD